MSRNLCLTAFLEELQCSKTRFNCQEKQWVTRHFQSLPALRQAQLRFRHAKAKVSKVMDISQPLEPN